MQTTHKKQSNSKRVTKKRTTVVSNPHSTPNTKPDWDTVSTKETIEHNGKTYTVIVIPKNTYVYRGFLYGDDPNDFTSEEDKKETEILNAEQYNKRKNAGIYYANLAIACYYAYNPDYGKRANHVVVEYKTKKPIKIVDMSVWQNLKNIVDDVPELNELLEITHGFKSKKPKSKLKRFSGGTDDEMTESMKEWLKSNPVFNGFGHLIMPGFHSEFTCVDRNNLKEENEYVSDNYTNIELVNKKYANMKDVRINMENLSFTNGMNKKRFKVKSLLD